MLKTFSFFGYYLKKTCFLNILSGSINVENNLKKAIFYIFTIIIVNIKKIKTILPLFWSEYCENNYNCVWIQKKVSNHQANVNIIDNEI